MLAPFTETRTETRTKTPANPGTERRTKPEVQCPAR